MPPKKKPDTPSDNNAKGRASAHDEDADDEDDEEFASDDDPAELRSRPRRHPAASSHAAMQLDEGPAAFTPTVLPSARQSGKKQKVVESSEFADHQFAASASSSSSAAAPYRYDPASRRMQFKGLSPHLADSASSSLPCGAASSSTSQAAASIALPVRRLEKPGPARHPLSEAAIEIKKGDYRNADLEGLAKNTPVAVCSHAGRYHTNSGRGAMKYQPVTCSEILSPPHCDVLRWNRGAGGKMTFHFQVWLDAGCQDFSKKVMTVPSVGCPELLGDTDFCLQLLWGSQAKKRPTFLVVHESEVRYYLTNIEAAMTHCGVGIVSWSCSARVLGFGTSRLAAQLFGMHKSERKQVVMSDVNVINSNALVLSYDTDNEETIRKSVKSGGLYISSGQGAGTPGFKWQDNKMVGDKNEGGAGRPLEQVITVGGKSFYDPCFITSSEDGDMTAAFLARENAARGNKGKPVSTTTFRSKTVINKVELPDFHTTKYMIARNAYLAALRSEDDINIIYRISASQFKLDRDDKQILGKDAEPIIEPGEMQELHLTVGELANDLASQHGLPQAEIRSLIIESILLRHKWPEY